MIHRKQLENISKQLNNPALPKGVIIYGPRQVGKTTLTQELLTRLDKKALVLSGDAQDSNVAALTTRDLNVINPILAGYELLVVDEAQRIKEIGLTAKLIIDNHPELTLILTGSSSLDLASKVGEPLTGRAYDYHLWPISQAELSNDLTYAERLGKLDEYLIYGQYPRLLTIPGVVEKKEYLLTLVDKYLYKDILDFGGIKNSTKIKDLLKLLAYQVGSQVSMTELATQLEISRDAVSNYINLLEASFIIFRLRGFSRNLRSEVHKMPKIYFWDNGIRNALINNFEYKSTRGDWGQLWENYIITERLKRNEYERWYANYYFWRLSTGAELDLIEQKSENLVGFEIKANTKLPKAPMSWLHAYPTGSYQVVNSSNWDQFVVGNMLS